MHDRAMTQLSNSLPPLIRARSDACARARLMRGQGVRRPATRHVQVARGPANRDHLQPLGRLRGHAAIKRPDHSERSSVNPLCKSRETSVTRPRRRIGGGSRGDFLQACVRRCPAPSRASSPQPLSRESRWPSEWRVSRKEIRDARFCTRRLARLPAKSVATVLTTCCGRAAQGTGAVVQAACSDVAAHVDAIQNGSLVFNSQ